MKPGIKKFASSSKRNLYSRSVKALIWFKDLVSRFPLPAIFIVGLLACGATLRVGFLWDDHEMIEKNPWVRTINAQTLKHAFAGDVFNGKGNNYYRPVQTLFNMWDYRVWNLNPLGFHITNLLLHLISALLLFQLIKLGFKNEQLALLTSVLFVIHPIIVEQLIIIAGRAELLAMTFGLAFLLCALQNSWKMTFLAAFFYGLAALSKESGVIFPFFLPLFGLLNPELRLSLRKYLAFAVVLAGYFLLRHFALPVDLTQGLSANFFSTLFKDLPATFVEYIRILFFPVDLHSHRRLVVTGGTVALSYAVIALLALFFWKRRKGFDLFCLGWFFLGFAPKLGLFWTNSLILDHWAYLSLPAFCLFLGRGLISLANSGKGKNSLAWGLAGLIFVLWLGMAWMNEAVRNTDKKLYEWALKFPSSSVVRSNLGQIYYFEGNFREAERLIKQSLAMAPGNPSTINNLVLVYWKEGNREAALKLLNELIAKDPGYLQSFVNRAVILRGTEGLKDLKHVLDVDPNYEIAWAIVGSILVERNKLDEAILAYKEVVRINPGNVQALVDLGTLNALKGRFEEASAYWRKTLDVDPGNKIALKNLIWLDKKYSPGK